MALEQRAIPPSWERRRPAGELNKMHDALDRLAALDPEQAEFVKLCHFVGLSLEEAARALGVSLPTAKRWWLYARAWLKVEMRRN